MILNKQVQENFSQASAAYDVHASLQQELMQRVLEAAEEVFAPNARLLDIGCGTGLFSEKGQQWDVLNLDIAAGMCDRARERSATVQANAVSLPVKDAALDGVVSSLCLQWVSHRQAAFNEIARVLKPGGHAVLMTLTEGTLIELTGTRLQLLPMDSLHSYEHGLQESGLELVRVEHEPLKKVYASLNALLHSMRTIGAGHAFVRHQGLGPQYFQKIREEFTKRHGNMATWQPALLIARKKVAV